MFAAVLEPDCPVVTPGETFVVGGGDRRSVPLFARSCSLIVAGLGLSVLPSRGLVLVEGVGAAALGVELDDTPPAFDEPGAPPVCAKAPDARVKPISKTGIAYRITVSPFSSTNRVWSNRSVDQRLEVALATATIVNRAGSVHAGQPTADPRKNPESRLRKGTQRRRAPYQHRLFHRAFGRYL